MKTLKVYEDAHLGCKVAAAKSGRTTTTVASMLIRFGLKKIESGELQLDQISGESNPKPQTEQPEARKEAV